MIIWLDFIARPPPARHRVPLLALENLAPVMDGGLSKRIADTQGVDAGRWNMHLLASTCLYVMWTGFGYVRLHAATFGYMPSHPPYLPKSAQTQLKGSVEAHLAIELNIPYVGPQAHHIRQTLHLPVHLRSATFGYGGSRK
ncbi:hypothetical protein B0H16DRAFT_1698297 [Mycena metata]|uniref:Uncharacterized protein n=1 Tax=Mycena metata TaxID=1033252 RepID=A0AAD7HPU1_9AGAR|nr:hypothetical protein B0H16DRAFT_1698297 [Mycena metata]